MQVDRLEFVQGVFKLKQAESFQRRKAKGTLDHKVEGLGAKLQTVGAFTRPFSLSFCTTLLLLRTVEAPMMVDAAFITWFGPHADHPQSCTANMHTAPWFHMACESGCPWRPYEWLTLVSRVGVESTGRGQDWPNDGRSPARAG